MLELLLIFCWTPQKPIFFDQLRYPWHNLCEQNTKLKVAITFFFFFHGETSSLAMKEFLGTPITFNQCSALAKLCIERISHCLVTTLVGAVGSGAALPLTAAVSFLPVSFWWGKSRQWSLKRWWSSTVRHSMTCFSMLCRIFVSLVSNHSSSLYNGCTPWDCRPRELHKCVWFQFFRPLPLWPIPANTGPTVRKGSSVWCRVHPHIVCLPSLVRFHAWKESTRCVSTVPNCVHRVGFSKRMTRKGPEDGKGHNSSWEMVLILPRHYLDEQKSGRFRWYLSSIGYQNRSFVHRGASKGSILQRRFCSFRSSWSLVFTGLGGRNGTVLAKSPK